MLGNLKLYRKYQMGSVSRSRVCYLRAATSSLDFPQNIWKLSLRLVSFVFFLTYLVQPGLSYKHCQSKTGRARLIGFKAICIPLVGEVIVFPILQSPPDERLIFRTCQLHTAWEFLHGNGGSERPAPWHAFVHSHDLSYHDLLLR